ncbi:antirestriction protein ArdA [Bordetella bronchiseptica]|uniref:antirestriction protein ArdA n=1 Tax=Bordetella bronchiseptica TaxID=518 RepID=UPI000461779C|nr:antirestriction protein ArdA [Bordetella bronchiseptica]KDD18619.1 hypothetical protein L522_4189 [Bordetella bronchiseptica MBORD707]
MTHTIDNSADIIDSRDVIARLEELQDEQRSLAGDVAEAEENVRHHHGGELDEAGDYPEHDEWRECRDALDDWEADNLDELESLRELADRGLGYGDWEHGEALIRESYFEEYAQELAEDCGMIQQGASWPNNCIDWEQAARELKVDYVEIDFDGVTYLMRA